VIEGVAPAAQDLEDFRQSPAGRRFSDVLDGFYQGQIPVWLRPVAIHGAALVQDLAGAFKGEAGRILGVIHQHPFLCRP